MKIENKTSLSYLLLRYLLQTMLETKLEKSLCPASYFSLLLSEWHDFAGRLLTFWQQKVTNQYILFLFRALWRGSEKIPSGLRVSYLMKIMSKCSFGFCPNSFLQLFLWPLGKAEAYFGPVSCQNCCHLHRAPCTLDEPRLGPKFHL